MSTTAAVSTALAANASVQASVAAQQAHEASVTSCMAFMSGFQGRGASVQEARQYSSCVTTVYPKPSEFTIEIPGKALVGTCLILVIFAIIIGLWNKRKASRWDDVSWFEIIFIYPLGGVIAWGIGWSIYVGIIYLMS